MDPTAAFSTLREQMLGRTVAYKRLFLSTLQLYLALDGKPDSDVEVWCEGTWHVAGPSGVLAGSGAITFDPDAEDPDAEQRAMSVATDVLLGPAPTLASSAAISRLSRYPSACAGTGH